MGERCTLTIHRTGSGCLIRVAGRGTMWESPSVRDFVCGTIEGGADVVLDLSECEYLDSTFLGCLVMLHERGKTRDGSFAVFADQSRREKVLGSVRLHRLLSFVDECPHCLGDPVGLNVSVLEGAAFGHHLLETHRRLAELGGPAAPSFRRAVKQLEKELNVPPS